MMLIWAFLEARGQEKGFSITAISTNAGAGNSLESLFSGNILR